MIGHSRNRLPLGAVLVLGLLGCTLQEPARAPQTDREGTVRNAVTIYKGTNAGQIIGAVAANDEVKRIAGVTDFAGATISAYDPDGAKVAGPANLNADGTFALGNFKDSRPRIFLEVTLKNIYFRTVTKAPRLANETYEVVLDPGTTFLADKLRRSALDHEVPFDRLNDETVQQTEEIIQIYLNRSDELGVQEDVLTRGTLSSAAGQAKLDLNANSFDYFAERHEPVKVAVYHLSKGIWRGWRPTPSPSPSPTPTAEPTATPTPTPTPTETLLPS